MKPDEKDDLWYLLGKAQQPEVSPFFSRNVVRQARAQSGAHPSLFGWLLREWQMTAVTAAACVVLGLSLAQHLAEPPGPEATLARQIENPADYEVIEDLDVLLASDQNSVWIDSTNSVF